MIKEQRAKEGRVENEATREKKEITGDKQGGEKRKITDKEDKEEPDTGMKRKISK